MLPTKYRGDAVIDGERMAAELHLNSDSIRLALGPNQEVLRWPIMSLEVAATSRGTYELRHGAESFTFEPNVDDGLGDEISLRRRFVAEVPLHEEEKPEPFIGPVAQAIAAASNGGESIADRVTAAGRHRRTKALLERAAPRLRSVVLGLATLVLVTGLAVVLSIMFDDVEPALDAAPDQNAVVAPEGETPEVAGVTVTAPEPTVPPTTALPVTVPPTTPPTTEGPPTTTVDLATSVWEMTPEQLAERWDAVTRPFSSTLMSSGFSVGDGRFSFSAGPFVRIEGSTSDGRVRQISFLGDPSGTVADDREVLTALGITVGMVEPRLPPEGRRELVSALGLDVENPVLADVDDTLDYLDNRYSLRFDRDSLLLIFQVEPAR